MTPERYQQIKGIYLAARDMAEDDRTAYLDQVCAGDDELRQEVEQLLSDQQRSTTFLEGLAAEVGAAFNETLDAGERSSLPAEAFPDYTLVRELNRGGQGIVYQAVQKATKQKVAIKVLLEGPYASQTASRRFEREIELVAQLKHPNIVSVLHAGRTADGRQFYVMEYVRGTPLTAYVRQNKLPLEDALRLFAKICEAVQFAHQRGIIHRDLKPANILVNGKGEPKILDFGLAKWLASPADSLVSVTQHPMGTLPYMSPEQARGLMDELDTRTDIYSLGVILYEMLTGAYPYPVVGEPAAVLRHIAEDEPTPPSRNWTPDSGIAQTQRKRRSFHFERRSGQAASPIDDEVETIVLKSLAKERSRRYQAAGELARDIGHYLEGEPIEARRDSALYVLKKQLRRYRGQVTAGVVFVVLLAVFGAVMTVLSERNARQKVENARQAKENRRLADDNAAIADREREARELAEQKQEEAEAARTEAVEQRDRAVAAEHEAQEERKRADDKAKLAEEKATEAERQRELAEWQTYVANIRAADVALKVNRVEDACRHLEAAPRRFRNWEWGYLHAQTDVARAVMHGYLGGHTRTAFGRAGLRYAVQAIDPSFVIRDVATGRLVADSKGCTELVVALAFSPDEKHIVAGDYSDVVRLFDAETGEVIAKVGEFDDGVDFISYSPDGTKIALASRYTAVVVEATCKGEPLTLGPTASSIMTVAFDVDGKQVWLATWDGVITSWDAESARRDRTLLIPGNRFDRVLFTADCRRVLTCDSSGAVRLWEKTDGRELRKVREFGGIARAVALSADGSLVAAGLRDEQAVRVWDVANGRELVTLQGHTGAINSVAFSPRGDRLFSLDSNGTMRVWDVAKRNPSRIRLGSLRNLHHTAVSDDGAYTLAVTSDEQLELWETTAGRRLNSAYCNHPAVFASFCPDSDRIVLGLARGGAALFDTASGKIVSEFRGHGWPVCSAAVSRDGTHVVTGSYDNTAKFWEADTGREVGTLRGHQGNVKSVWWSADGARIMTHSLFDGTLRVWEATTCRELFRVGGDSSPVRRSRVASESERIVVESRMTVTREYSFYGLSRLKTIPVGTVSTWDLVSGCRLFASDATQSGRTLLALSKDGRLIVTVNESHGIEILDADTGRVSATLSGSWPSEVDVAFSPDGKRLITAAGDRELKVWDLGTCSELLTLDANTEAIQSVAFSSDGSRIVARASLGSDFYTREEAYIVWDSVPYAQRCLKRGALVPDEHAAIASLESLLEEHDDWNRVAESLRSDDALSDEGRRFALDLVLSRSVSEREAVRQAARRIPKGLITSADRVEFFLADDSLSPRVQRELKRAIEEVGDDSKRLNDAAWRIVLRTDAEPEEYAGALRAAELAVGQSPETWEYHNTLGVAYYRVGAYEKAQESLSMSDSMRAAGGRVRVGGCPADVAFIAMSLHQLGRTDAAAWELDRLKTLMQQNRWAEDDESTAFLHEAEALIEGAGSPTPQDVPASQPTGAIQPVSTTQPVIESLPTATSLPASTPYSALAS